MANLDQTSISKQRLFRHLVLPAIAPAALVWLYFTPKTVFGCANRGYMALAVVLLAATAAVATTAKGISKKRRGDTESANWWLLTTLILLLPIALLVNPLG